MQPQMQVLEAWGELACFTRPELKVERFSYPVITPSAARGIFDAIFCKPNRDPTKAEFRWQIKRIEILRPPQYIALRRNEVKEKISVDRVSSWMTGKELPEPIWADGTKEMLGTDMKGRTQRQTLALKDVRYRLHAEIRPHPAFADRLRGLEAQFQRRARGGKCFYQPYFGCREFPAYFELVEPDEPLAKPVSIDLDIGLMVYDTFDLSTPDDAWARPCISVFQAVIKGGILEVPDYDSHDVLKGIGGER